MNNIFRTILFPSLLLLMLSSCEKDNITAKVEDLVSTEKKMETDLKQNLANSPNGWVIMVKSALADTACIPVVMKFDTAKNMVKMRSIYGTTTSNNSNYLINKGVSGILLNFSGGSIISSIMRMGANYSNVTDYVFKVLEVTPSSIKIQCLKSGEAYKQEGGPTFTLFKRPDSWKWADEPMLLDMRTLPARADITAKDGILSLTNAKSTKKVNIGVNFNTSFDSNLAAWQGVDPFFTNASANIFDKYYIFYTYVNYSNTGTIQTTYEDFAVARQGHNALYYIPFSGNTYSLNSNATFIKNTKLPYLVINEVIRVGTNVTIKVASYDKEGKEYISGEYRNFNQ